MKFHHGLALLAIVVPPVLAGLVMAIEAGYRKLPAGGVFLCGLLAVMLVCVAISCIPMLRKSPRSLSELR